MAEQNVSVVIGASGGAGASVVRVLAAQGKRVRAVGRHPLASLPAGVEGVVGDCTDPTQASAFCQDAAAIYLCANVPYHQWEQVFPSIITGAIAGAKTSGGKLIFCDNLYMYAPTEAPLTEQTPLAPITRKGKLRVRLAEQLFATHQRGEIRMAIGRTSDFYGRAPIRWQEIASWRHCSLESRCNGWATQTCPTRSPIWMISRMGW